MAPGHLSRTGVKILCAVTFPYLPAGFCIQAMYQQVAADGVKFAIVQRRAGSRCAVPFLWHAQIGETPDFLARLHIERTDHILAILPGDFSLGVFALTHYMIDDKNLVVSNARVAPA